MTPDEQVAFTTFTFTRADGAVRTTDIDPVFTVDQVLAHLHLTWGAR